MEPIREDDTGELELPPPQETPRAYERVEPRYFGVTPHVLAAVLAAAALLAGVALLAGGSTAVGALLVVAGLFLALLFAEQARRRRESSLDRAAASAVDRSLAVGGFAKATVGAWTHAGRRAAKLRLEAARLARRRSHVQYDLGGAVHAGDAPRVERLRDEMRELDFAIEERARTAKAALERAHRRTKAERGAVATTEIRRPTPR